MPCRISIRLRRACIRAAVCALLAAPLPSSSQTIRDATGLSKQMNIAIGLFEDGKDLDAMDRFMEILVKGDPVERPMANEYLNMITQRMALGSKFDAKLPPRATVVEEVPSAAVGAAKRMSRPELPPEELGPRRDGEGTLRSQGKISKSDREVMRREIDAKIQNRTRVLLGQIRKYEEVKVRMANSRLPRAIGIPASMLFENDFQFKKDSVKILDLLTHLIFSLGATQVIILPERAVQGDAKITDMRRTMGVSSHFLKAGIAPARLRVNLLSTQVDIPRDLTDFSGILVLFVYNQPLQLTTDSAVGTEAGPPVSLGSSPDEIDSREGDGTIIEISVLEPPSGLMSWRFQLLGPGAVPGDDLVPIQEVKGSAPVFHQIFWNAREKYFGAALPPGRYEAVLSATDLRNHTRKLHRWLTVKGERPAPAKPAVVASAQPAVSAQAELPPAELPGTPKRSRGKTLFTTAKKPARRTPRAAARKSPTSTIARRAEPDGAAAGDASGGGEEGARRANTVNYTIPFEKGSPNIQSRGESTLTRVADTMHYYPLDNINLVGYASSSEQPDPQGLASQRAELVAKLLVERHSMKRDRIRIQQKVAETSAPKVEIYIVAGGN